GFQAIGPNGAEALGALALLYAAAPVALKLVAIAIMWRFPLDRAAHRAALERIAAAGKPSA
ncbi:MAG: MFS transporter, partial [Pseudomonadota bacterium]